MYQTGELYRFSFSKVLHHLQDFRSRKPPNTSLFYPPTYPRRLNFVDFEKRLNFDFEPLAKYLEEVFAGEAVISELGHLRKSQGKVSGRERSGCWTALELRNCEEPIDFDFLL